MDIFLQIKKKNRKASVQLLSHMIMQNHKIINKLL